MTQPTTVQFVLNIPTGLVNQVTSALCAAGGFADVTEANAKAAVIAWITQTVANVEAAQAYVPPPAPTPITGLS